jgi:hypothetical protein
MGASMTMSNFFGLPLASRNSRSPRSTRKVSLKVCAASMLPLGCLQEKLMRDLQSGSWSSVSRSQGPIGSSSAAA